MSALALAWQTIVCHKVLRNLDGVERRSFLDLVGYAPEGQPAFVGEVLAYAAYVYAIGAGQMQRHWVFESCRIVHQRDSRSVGKGRACLFDRDGALCLHPYCFGVSTHHRNAHAGSADLQVGGVHYFLGLKVHFHFLACVSVVGEYIDMGDDVVGQLIGKFFDGGFLAIGYLAVLALEFGHGRGSGTAGCLIGGDVYRLDG